MSKKTTTTQATTETTSVKRGRPTVAGSARQARLARWEALKAQGYTSLESSLLGVYLHGSAGDIAVKNIGQDSLIANDIIDHLGIAFNKLYGKS